MAKIPAMPSQDIISGFKGTLDFFVWKGIACCRAWPRPPSTPRSPSVQAQWPVFSNAAKLWPKMSWDVQRAYNIMAGASTLSGRDLSVKLYINARFIYPDLP